MLASLTLFLYVFTGVLKRAWLKCLEGLGSALVVQALYKCLYEIFFWFFAVHVAEVSVALDLYLPTEIFYTLIRSLMHCQQFG